MSEVKRVKGGIPPARRRSGRPTQRDTQRNSEVLLGIATDYFLERGFGGTTMEAVARAANVGRQAVYTRFTDKEALFNAVIRRLKETPLFEPQSLHHDLPLGEGLPECLRRIFLDAAKPEAVTVSKLALREGHRFPDLAGLMAHGLMVRLTQPLADYLAARARAGETLAIDPVETASLLIDLVCAEITRTVYTDTELDDARIEDAVARITRLALRGIMKA